MTDEESHEDQSEHQAREQRREQEAQRQRTSVAPPTEAIILKSSD